MKRLLFFSIFLLTAQFLASQLVITEIMYNPPEAGDDSTEYIEILNISQQDINLLNYAIAKGAELVFGDTTLASGQFLVITKDADAFASYYGFWPIQWTDGSLSNSGEDIELKNALGDRVDFVPFDDENGWPVAADGQGFSLELCDPFRDNSLPENWKVSKTANNLIIELKTVFASPGLPNEISCDDAINHTIDVLSLQFDPKFLTIYPGETVQWINNSGVNHNVNGSLSAYPDNPEGFYSGAPSNDNWVFAHTFTIPGTYRYKCDLHSLLGMTGTIEVLPEEAAKLLFTEIMYNDPGNQDSLEFIELHNKGSESIPLEGFMLKSGNLEYVFPEYAIAGGEYLVICRDSSAFVSRYGIPVTLAWETGSLGNNGDLLQLLNLDGVTIDEINYDDDIPWSSLADGLGHSLSLCRPDMDNSLPENWQETPVTSGVFENGLEIFANPGVPNYCGYDIGEINQLHEDGTMLYMDLGVEISGTVYGVNLRPGGLQFTLIDGSSEGIALYHASRDFGYAVQEGNRIIAIGKTGQYNGLAQIYLDTLFFFGHQTDLLDPKVVTTLGEDTESQLVKLENVMLVNPAQWGQGTSGFNVEVSDGTNTYQVRIDNDVDVFSQNYPTGSFDLTGIGGQFDSAPPYLEGYQLLPRYAADFDPFLPNQYPDYPIGLVSTVNAEGVGDSIDVKCRVEGTVYGINFYPPGLSFTLIDDQNDGINVYSGNNDTGYQMKEGDRIGIKGTIHQYNGLLELLPDEIEWISSDNPLVDPLDVTELNEETESQLVRLGNLSLVEPSQWLGDGNNFNVQVTNGSEPFVLRIDKDCELSGMTAPQGIFHISGIGSQYDTSVPYLEGYQLFPRYAADLDLADNTRNGPQGSLLSIRPNPFGDYLEIRGLNNIRRISTYSIDGQLIDRWQTDKTNISTADWEPGVYLLFIESMEGVFRERVVKIQD